MSENKNLQKSGNLLFKVILFITIFAIWQKLVVSPLANKSKNKKEITDFTKVETTQKNNITKINEGEKVILENDFLKLTINTVGLEIKDLQLKKFTTKVGNNEFVNLLNEKQFITIDWLAFNDKIEIPNIDTKWIFDKQAYLKNKRELSFTFTNSNNITFKTILSFDSKYMLNVSHKIKNNSDKKLFLKPVLEIVKKDEILRDEIGTFNGGIGVFDEKKVIEIKNKKLKNKNIEFDKINWGGFTSKYWLVALINENINNGKANFLKVGNNLKMQYTLNNNLIILPNSEGENNVKLFLGVKDKKILNEYQKNNKIALFDRSIDYGMLFFLTNPMSTILNGLYNIFKDFGVAIILFTILIKLVLYNFTKKSTISMSKMKNIQPKILEMQSIYKNDKITLQNEIMKVYKSNDINPLGSIVPLFVQIPIFFALYKVLNISLNMRQANFLSFIKDLSIGDPSNIFNLFGLLPFETKFTIGILPCLMALTMFIQQKTMDPSKNKNIKQSEEVQTANNVLKWMPLILLFMFSGLPAGLLLYWIVNNIITILQQLYIEKKYMSK